MTTRPLRATQIAQLVELAGAAPQAPTGQPPKDSILGAVLSLLHGALDGMIAATPKNLQTSTSLDRGGRPLRVHLRGSNSQGLPSRLDLVVDLDLSRGLAAVAALSLANAQGQTVWSQRQRFAVTPADSTKDLVRQYQQWITQAETLQTAPIGMTGAPVFLR